VNGKLTLAENIADLGGLLIAWDALQKALAADPAKRQSIDGLTPEQRFFISYAQSWCVLERSERVKQSLLTDEHAPAETRANGPLMHVPEFYEAFGIKKGAKMWLAPEKRAVIW
jgi:putative endopeptidase